jgi:NitT/TauT family transport system ATP-binding protein
VQPLQSLTPTPARETLVGARLTLNGVGRVFTTSKRSVVALDDVSFSVEPGESIALIGPSGAGKSTLLRLVADLDQPTQGRILLDQSSPAEARRTGWIGMVFQESVLLPWRTALENVLLPAQVGYGRRAEGEGHPRERAAALLDRMGLSGFHDAYIWQLSGGMRQRVSIARALMLHPRLLLLDEPFGALDEITRERMNGELGRVLDASGATSILVTHSISEAILLADRVVVLSAHPGKLYRVQPVPLPRPRSVDQMFMPEFVELSMTLRKLLAAAEARN